MPTLLLNNIFQSLWRVHIKVSQTSFTLPLYACSLECVHHGLKEKGGWMKDLCEKRKG